MSCFMLFWSKAVYLAYAGGILMLVLFLVLMATDGKKYTPLTPTEISGAVGLLFMVAGFTKALFFGG